MAEPQTPATPQAGEPGSTSPQAGNTTPSVPQAGNGKTPLSVEEYERKLAEANREAAAHRVKLKKYEDEEAARQQAAMTDLQKAQAEKEKLQAERTELEQKLRERIVRSEVALQASALGIAHPEKVYRLIDTDTLKFDDATGEPTNVKALIEKLLQEMPELVATASQQARSAPATGANNPGRANVAQPGTLPAGQRMNFHDAYSTRK